MSRYKYTKKRKVPDSNRSVKKRAGAALYQHITDVDWTHRTTHELDNAEQLVNRIFSKELNIPNTSGYWDKLTVALEKARSQIISGKPPFQKAEPKEYPTLYAGFVKKGELYVEFKDDYFFFSSYYGRDKTPSDYTAKVTWRFNNSARIEQIDMILSHNPQTYDLINVIERIKQDWTKAKAKYAISPPKDINCISPEFQDRLIIFKYESLLKFGHGNASSIRQELGKDRIKPVSDPQGSTPLTDIVKNEKAWEKIKQVALLNPTIKESPTEYGYFTIIY